MKWRQELGPGVAVAVVEVPLLFEAAMEDAFDATVAVVADDGIRDQRLTERGQPGLEGREARQMGLRVPDQRVTDILRMIGQQARAMGARLSDLEALRPALERLDRQIPGALVDLLSRALVPSPPIETSVSQPCARASATRYSSLRVLLPPYASPLLQSSRLAHSLAPPRCFVSRSRGWTGDGPNMSGWRAKESRRMGTRYVCDGSSRPDITGTRRACAGCSSPEC